MSLQNHAKAVSNKTNRNENQAKNVAKKRTNHQLNSKYIKSPKQSLIKKQSQKVVKQFVVSVSKCGAVAITNSHLVEAVHFRNTM